jgi:hypothetical protein
MDKEQEKEEIVGKSNSRLEACRRLKGRKRLMQC